MECIGGISEDEKCYSLDIDAQDNIYLYGNYLVKFDSNGIQNWDVSF
ncbi:MAG: hypothetical protein ACFFG0_19025 [Candidatus Thorarchaeota archaeon]